MTRAIFRPVEAAGPCPSCGALGHPRLRLVTEDKGRTAWNGCAFCLALAQLRGQEDVLVRLCREANRDEKPRPNAHALMRE